MPDNTRNSQVAEPLSMADLEAAIGLPRSAVVLGALRGWPAMVLLPVLAVELTPSDWPRWALTVTLTLGLYSSFKWLTWRRTPAPQAPLWRHLGYLIAWPGMDAAGFLNTPLNRDQAPPAGAWLLAISKLMLGVGLVYVAAHFSHELPAYVDAVLGVTGIGLILLFGIFHVLSCFWRSVGVKAPPPMYWPALSQSVSAYWGRRWNTAFRDLAHRFFFRPFTAWYGQTAGLLAGFLFSGIVHDLVISLPARGGYGGPTLFFILQALGIFAERSTLGRRLGLGRGWRGWAFTMLVLMLPMPLLFHRAVLYNVVLPLFT